MRSRIEMVEANTSVGVVKKCSRKSVTKEIIRRAVYIRTCGTSLGTGEPIVMLKTSEIRATHMMNKIIRFCRERVDFSAEELNSLTPPLTNLVYRLKF
jgi:hypothetical protein